MKSGYTLVEKRPTYEEVRVLGTPLKVGGKCLRIQLSQEANQKMFQPTCKKKGVPSFPSKWNKL
jgi:hypothetical protein